MTPGADDIIVDAITDHVIDWARCWEWDFPYNDVNQYPEEIRNIVRNLLETDKTDDGASAVPDDYPGLTQELARTAYALLYVIRKGQMRDF